FKRISVINVVHHLRHILQLENISYEDAALEILARSGAGSLRDTLTLLDQAIIYSKNHIDVQTVTDMLGLVDPQFIEEIFSAIFNRDREAIIAYIKELEEYEAEMVVDELIAFLKERLYAQDSRYSILLLERFFRILSDSKSLFSINAEGGFVLSMIFFKMLEALKVKEIDQMIESLEAQIRSGAPMPAPQSAPAAPQAAHEPRADVPAPQPEVPVPAAQPEAPLPEAVAPDAKARAMFEQLIQKIQDRSIDLGRCFKEQITFVSYEEGLLVWESCADDACKKQLKHGYSVIKQFVREIFGFETQIKAQKCSAAAPSAPPEQMPQTESESQTPTPQQSRQMAAPETSEPPQASSMTEEAEVGTGSCVASCSESDQSTKEFDGRAILGEPMIQKATELFEATKITIQNKV
ncbi:MAG: DNA polymerase III subunit gamma/tau, partial [Thiovulaceae bacterium]|nr:DNA polymerase III subunit gamma/tau [Sulfurimonadaceae bacterium]